MTTADLTRRTQCPHCGVHGTIEKIFDHLSWSGGVSNCTQTPIARALSVMTDRYNAAVVETAELQTVKETERLNRVALITPAIEKSLEEVASFQRRVEKLNRDIFALTKRGEDVSSLLLTWQNFLVTTKAACEMAASIADSPPHEGGATPQGER